VVDCSGGWKGGHEVMKLDAKGMGGSVVKVFGAAMTERRWSVSWCVEES